MHSTKKTRTFALKFTKFRMTSENKKTKFFQNREYSPVYEMFDAGSMRAFSLFMSRYGASDRTIEDRIRYRGFQRWEREGIASIFANILHLPTPVPGQDVFGPLDAEGRRELIATMADMGMCANTTRHRFSSVNFKEWEMIGFDALYKRYFSEEKN